MSRIPNEVAVIHTLIDQIYSTGKVQDKDGNTFDVYPHSIEPDRGQRLYKVVRESHARTTLEIGCAYGLSTLHICQALIDNGGGEHVAIDPFQFRGAVDGSHDHYHGVGLANVERAGFSDMFTHMEQKSYCALPELLKQGNLFDFVYIDGMHLFDYALVDFFYADLLISVGGYIAMDDLWMESQQWALSFILKNRSYKLVYQQPISALKQAWRKIKHPHSRPGMMDKADFAVLQKTGHDKRNWKHFEAF
jgi:predicted O-methyltransferase YrrM